MQDSSAFDSGVLRAMHARLAALTEIGAGLLVAAGLLTPIACAAIVALMLVAGWTVHRANGFFIVKSGWEYNFVLAIAAVAIAVMGSGRFSLDHLLGVPSPCGFWGLVIAGVGGLVAGMTQIAIFFRPPAKSDEPAGTP